MFLTKKATSVIEAVIVLLIVVSGVVGMYQVFSASQKLSSSTANKIQAIQIAREGIEAVKNIRDTNWILYSSDTANCWNVDGYNDDCVGATNTTNYIASGSYLINQKSDNRWYLETKTTDTSFNQDYRDRFEVFTDKNGFFTQTGVLDDSKFKIKPLFTREIKINYPETYKMEVVSLVQWVDLSSSKPHRVEFRSVLTNWKK